MKLKENVDLKVLEELGFQFIDKGDDWYFIKESLPLSETDKQFYKNTKKKHYYCNIYIANNDEFYFQIFYEMGKNTSYGYTSKNENFYIKDLIEKGLVE